MDADLTDDSGRSGKQEINAEPGDGHSGLSQSDAALTAEVMAGGLAKNDLSETAPEGPPWLVGPPPVIQHRFDGKEERVVLPWWEDPKRPGHFHSPVTDQVVWWDTGSGKWVDAHGELSHGGFGHGAGSYTQVKPEDYYPPGWQDAPKDPRSAEGPPPVIQHWFDGKEERVVLHWWEDPKRPGHFHSPVTDQVVWWDTGSGKWVDAHGELSYGGFGHGAGSYTQVKPEDRDEPANLPAGLPPGGPLFPAEASIEAEDHYDDGHAFGWHSPSAAKKAGTAKRGSLLDPLYVGAIGLGIGAAVTGAVFFLSDGGSGNGEAGGPQSTQQSLQAGLAPTEQKSGQPGASHSPSGTQRATQQAQSTQSPPAAQPSSEPSTPALTRDYSVLFETVSSGNHPDDLSGLRTVALRVVRIVETGVIDIFMTINPTLTGRAQFGDEFNHQGGGFSVEATAPYRGFTTTWVFEGRVVAGQSLSGRLTIGGDGRLPGGQPIVYRLQGSPR